ncbi:MAG: EAL domain-containing response regulator [Acidobacteria bacterium]|nr:EAL domain-containing response regulator [Acidobacteriota bacterium]
MLRVLVLDDESIVLDMLAVCLRAPGVLLTTCREIEAAEALLKGLRFDVVIADLSVSELGGLDGIRLIRFVTTHFPDTVTYVLSGFVDEPVRDLCKMLGVTAVLEKPGGLAELRALVLGNRPAAAPEDSPEEAPPVQDVELLSEFMASNRIRSVLQPVVGLQRGGAPYELFGVEGLARGPATSLLGNPVMFLSYAAHKELLFEADLICIRAALAEVQRLGRVVNTFLNVQPRSLSNPEFTEMLGHAVRQAGLREQNVILELTEQQTIVNPLAFATALQRLRERGFRIALDDYGEGSSNLNLLLNLRPEYLKISGTFCRQLDRDPFKQTLVQSTAEMAARTGIATIMEAVETAAEAEILHQLGIDYGQGFYFLEPLPGRELARSRRIGLTLPGQADRLSPIDAGPPVGPPAKPPA